MSIGKPQTVELAVPHILITVIHIQLQVHLASQEQSTFPFREIGGICTNALRVKMAMELLGRGLV